MIDERKRVYIDMLNDMILPNIYTLNMMVNAYSKMGNTVEANLYVSKIFLAGLSPYIFTYTSLIPGYCRLKLLNLKPLLIVVCNCFDSN